MALKYKTQDYPKISNLKLGHLTKSWLVRNQNKDISHSNSGNQWSNTLISWIES